MIEADEMWSFVGSKGNVPWIWAAVDAETRRVVAVVVGDRSEFAAWCLGHSRPDDYRERAVFRTDFLPAYRAVIPQGRHVPGGTGDGVTSYVERFWCTVRQRCGRFVRKTRSFSKCLENHLGALWFFIHDYNRSRS